MVDTMIGVIIAAGKGKRLSAISGGRPKTLVEVNGKAMIQWIIRGLREVGVEKFLLVVGYEHEKIREYFTDHEGDDTTFVYNPRWEQGNGISVLSVSEYIPGDEPFILAMSDHLIGGKGLRAFVRMKDRFPLLLVERNLSNVFDIQDATKVMVNRGRVAKIGKRIRNYNGVDAGLFLLDRRIFDFLKRSVEKGKDSLTAGIKLMINESVLNACPMPEDVYWIDVDSEQSYRNAMKMWRCL
jgi:CDP-L-myo-inositol myo-inositolphosphotransferase